MLQAYYDESVCEQYEDVICALTLSSVVHHDAKIFLQEKLETAKTTVAGGLQPSNPRAKMLFEAAQQDLQDIDLQQIPTCIRIEACGHVFSGAPLLYELISRAFTCPLCRHGSRQTVDIHDTDIIPANMDKHLWRVLCFLAQHARKSARVETDHHPGLFLLSQHMGNDTTGMILLVVEFLVQGRQQIVE